MQLEQTFSVAAGPDATFAFLMDVNRVAACIPGVESVEERSPDMFVGSLRIKVGPVGIRYRGTASITERDQAARRASVDAEGVEGVGAGRVKATAVMTVEAAGDGSTVRIATDLAIAGKLAGFGRGIIEAVAKRIVGQMADCIRTQLERDEDAPSVGSTEARPST